MLLTLFKYLFFLFCILKPPFNKLNQKILVFLALLLVFSKGSSNYGFLPLFSLLLKEKVILHYTAL